MLARSLAARFSDAPDVPATLANNETLGRIAARGSCRAFTGTPVPPETLRALAAIALSSPSKSDLQQRDILLVQDPALLASLKDMLSDQPWIADAPAMVIFLANNRRQRLWHDWQSLPFANDHLDAFFNATVDAAIALSAFVIAAEAAGYGCCPISTIRNHSTRVSDLLHLPDHVFAIAGLAVGTPAAPVKISARLPLFATVHTDSYTEKNLAQAIAEYDAARPMTTQRRPNLFGRADPYTWSLDKSRQYTLPERTDFGAFIRAKGFSLE